MAGPVAGGQSGLEVDGVGTRPLRVMAGSHTGGTTGRFQQSSMSWSFRSRGKPSDLHASASSRQTHPPGCTSWHLHGPRRHCGQPMQAPLQTLGDPFPKAPVCHVRAQHWPVSTRHAGSLVPESADCSHPETAGPTDLAEIIGTQPSDRIDRAPRTTCPCRPALPAEPGIPRVGRCFTDRTQKGVIGAKPGCLPDFPGIMTRNAEPDSGRDRTEDQGAGGFGREVEVPPICGSGRPFEGNPNPPATGPHANRFHLGRCPGFSGRRTDHKKTHSRGNRPGKTGRDPVGIRVVEAGGETTPGPSREGIDQRLVGREPGPEREFIRPAPGKRLSVTRMGVPLERVRRIKGDRKPSAGSGPSLPAEQTQVADPDAQFLFCFTPQGLLGQLPGLHLATRKLPEPRPGPAGRPFLDQESPRIVRKTEGHDRRMLLRQRWNRPFHLPPFAGVRSTPSAILTNPGSARDSSCT